MVCGVTAGGADTASHTDEELEVPRSSSSAPESMARTWLNWSQTAAGLSPEPVLFTAHWRKRRRAFPCRLCRLVKILSDVAEGMYANGKCTLFWSQTWVLVPTPPVGQAPQLL